MLKALVSSLLLEQAAGHGWLVNPVSKNELNYAHRLWNGNYPGDMPDDFRYCPHCCANGNNGAGHFDSPAASCGANSDVFAQGLNVWQKWYDAAGIPVPELNPGSDFRVDAEMNADHGGQAWMQVACGSVVSENLNWTILERSASDRSRGFLPSTPGIYAWPVQSSGGGWSANYHVPASFYCPGGEAVGRWIWKTGNTCNDVNNVGRKTQTFQRSENQAVGLDRGTCAPGQAPETFISCISFRVSGSAPTTTPAPTTTRAPTTAPTTPRPTPAPTPRPPPGSCSEVWGQCGGDSWTGPTCCESGHYCKVQDERWFHQCVPGYGPPAATVATAGGLRRIRRSV